jgi:NMD protein affecting ribosome stability and mRNA decay
MFHDVPTCIMIQVVNGAVLQQTFVVEFIVHNQMCDDCHRVEAKDYWRAVVQIRQKVYSYIRSIHRAQKIQSYISSIHRAHRRYKVILAQYIGHTEYTKLYWLNT